MNKIKNFIEDIFLDIKNKFTSSKYVVKGKCNRCGQCCRSILFSNERGYIKSEKDFINLKAKKKIYSMFTPNGTVVGESDELNGAILFKCKHLKDNKCSIYFFRPLFCRDYPAINKNFIEKGGVMLDNCGYYFAPDKAFIEYLK